MALGRDVVLLPVLLAAAYLAVAPVWAPDVTAFRYDQARCLQLLLLAVLAVVVSLPAPQASTQLTWSYLTPAAKRLFVVWLAVGLISAAASLAPKLGMLEVGTTVLLVLLFLAVAGGVRARGALAEQTLAATITLGAGALVLQFWVLHGLTLLEGRPFSWESPFLEFANVRFFNQYQSYAILLLTMPIVLFRLPPAWRWLIYLVAVSFWALIWMVGARAVWAGFVAAVIVVLLFGRRTALRWLSLQAALLVAGGLVFTAFSAFQTETPSGRSAIPEKLSLINRGWQSVNERVIMARGATEMVADRPLLGVGPGQFGLHYTGSRAAHPHNSILYLFSEYGFIGGAAASSLGVMLLALAIRRLRESHRSDDAVTVALAGALTLGLFESLFSGNLVMPHSQVMLAVTGGWLLGRSQRDREPVEPKPVKNWTRWSLSAIALISATVVTLLAADYLLAVNALPGWLPERFPHFWQYGRWADW